MHETKASPDGGAPYLDAGQALTVDFQTQLAKGLGRTTQCEILPPNVLAYTPDLMVWWTRRQRRVMFYGGSSDGRTLSGRVFPQPPLVFKVCGSELSVRSLTEDRRPRPNPTDGSALLELRSPWRAGLSGKHARPGESVFVREEGMGECLLRERIHARGFGRTAHSPSGGLPGIRGASPASSEMDSRRVPDGHSGESLQSFVQAREG